MSAIRLRAVCMFSLLAACNLVTAADPDKLEPFRFVLLHAPERAPQVSDDAAAELRAAHAEHLRRLAGEGKVLLYGPVADGGTLRGVVVLDTDDDAVAREWIAADPWVAAGGLVPEMHPWWSVRRVFGRAAGAGAGGETGKAGTREVLLGLLRRPEDAPDLPPERLAEIQRGHMANMGAMAESRDLAIAGPFGDDGRLRGVFVFVTTDEARVRALAGRDPAIEANRLKLDLYRWSVPEGSIVVSVPAKD